MEDLEIVELYWNRDESALSETKNKYGNYCHAIAYSILHNNEDTEETLNDTYLAAWNSMPPHHPLNLSTYLGKLCRRLSLNRWRFLNAEKRGGGQVTLSLDELGECVPDQKGIREELEEKLLAESINDFLSELKESERKIFVCRYWYFDPIEEIAKRFGYTQSKVKMSLKRSRDKLRQHLLKEGILV